VCVVVVVWVVLSGLARRGRRRLSQLLGLAMSSKQAKRKQRQKLVLGVYVME
jgi:hypothetical protein